MGPGRSQKAPEVSSPAGVSIWKEAPGGRLRSHHSQPRFSEQKRSPAPAAGAGQCKGPEHACPGHVDAVPTMGHGPAWSPSPKMAAGRKGLLPTSHPGVKRKGPPWWAQGPGSLGVHLAGASARPQAEGRTGTAPTMGSSLGGVTQGSARSRDTPPIPPAAGSRRRWAGAALDTSPLGSRRRWAGAGSRGHATRRPLSTGVRGETW